MIEKERLSEWKNHPVSEELFKDLLDAKQAAIEAWANGATIQDPVENARYVGMLQVIDQVVNYNPLED